MVQDRLLPQGGNPGGQAVWLYHLWCLGLLHKHQQLSSTVHKGAAGLSLQSVLVVLWGHSLTSPPDPNTLIGDNIDFLQIPSVVTSWITWAFDSSHHCPRPRCRIRRLRFARPRQELSMSCLSSCISGFAASVALIAFVFDLVLFFTTKARINSLKGGSATIGSAIWLTLAAWILLFFSGCFYSIGRCCASNRSRSSNKWGFGNQDGQKDPYAEQMRLDAVKAEADRKARQAQQERGLPAFPGSEERKPLSSNYEPAYLEEERTQSPYRDNVAGLGRPTGPRSPPPPRQGTAHSSDPSDNSNGNYGSSAYATGYTPGQQGRIRVCYRLHSRAAREKNH